MVGLDESNTILVISSVRIILRQSKIKNYNYNSKLEQNDEELQLIHLTSRSETHGKVATASSGSAHSRSNQSTDCSPHLLKEVRCTTVVATEPVRAVIHRCADHTKSMHGLFCLALGCRIGLAFLRHASIRVLLSDIAHRNSRMKPICYSWREYTSPWLAAVSRPAAAAAYIYIGCRLT